MKGNLFIYFILFTLFAHLGVWIQLNAQFINNKFRSSNLLVVLLGIPLSWMWMKATQYGVQSFSGKFWPQRLISFSIGITIYTILTHFIFDEKFDLKSVVCLALAFSIVFIQVFWK